MNQFFYNIVTTKYCTENKFYLWLITKFSQCAIWKNKVCVFIGWLQTQHNGINENLLLRLVHRKYSNVKSKLKAGARVSIHPDVFVVHGKVGEDSIPREKSGSSSLFSQFHFWGNFVKTKRRKPEFFWFAHVIEWTHGRAYVKKCTMMTLIGVR